MAAEKHEDSFGESANPHDTTRLSLFDINMEKARALNKKDLIHRVIFVAKIRPGITERREIGGYYERLFKQLHSQSQGETFTGLLLIYPSHIVHVVETSTNILQEVIRSLESSESSGSGLVHQIKILVYAHDIPSRLFTQWSFRVLNIPTSRMDSYDSSAQSSETVCYSIRDYVDGTLASYLHQISRNVSQVSEAIVLLLKLGQYLAKIPKVSLKAAMDQLHEKIPDLLLPQDMIEYFCECSDLCSPKEYLDHYGKPFEIVLDSELVWPIPSYLLPLS